MKHNKTYQQHRKEQINKMLNMKPEHQEMIQKQFLEVSGLEEY